MSHQQIFANKVWLFEVTGYNYTYSSNKYNNSQIFLVTSIVALNMEVT